MKMVQKRIEAYEASGTVFGSINQKQLKSLEVISPSLEIVNEFHRIVKEVDMKIMNNERMNRNLSDIRDTLLPKLVSGEIEVGVGEATLD
jgi:type I restriction enzyme S subunit